VGVLANRFCAALDGLVIITVSVVHTENEHEIRIVSFRKASKRESQIYFDAIQN
jgi:uncharacterized DUF497 family protein